ncbi:MAG: AraC family transcriptional regulator [Raineya sp.]|jgi:AraC-like DNA-binding protein|nr:AraC family transcriptional regulator [Raineya sp.]
MPIHSFVPAPQAFTPYKDLKTLVENRSVYSLTHCELNVFETHQQSEKVRLCFNSLTFTSMLQGKKVMHLFGDKHFDYFPGESVIVPESEEMIIDFPEASLENPTQCIALAIDKEKIKEILEILNERFTKIENGEYWQIAPEQFHLQNTLELTGTINRLIRISKEDNQAKDIFANMALQELLIRLMQTQAREVIFSNYHKYTTSHRFAYVVEYIQNHLTDNLSVKQLSDLACMSEPHFYRSFKRELGIAPMEYVLQEKIKLAKKLLTDTSKSITDVCFQSGFNSLNHFCSIFKKMEQMSPKQYQDKIKKPFI